MAGSKIWVYLERDGKGFEESSLEILGESRRMADRHGHSITGIIIGSDISDLGKSAIGYGADDVLFLHNDRLDAYGTELYTKALTDAVKKKKPDSLIIGATRNGRDLAARAAARLRTGLAANVVTLDIDDEGRLFSGVPGYGSKVIANILCVKNKPQMSTVRGGIFAMNEFDAGRKGKTEVMDISLDGIENAVTVVSRITQETKDISSSERVIIAGNGAADITDLVERLAEIMHADIGATRPLADRNLYPRDVQVGSTGLSLKSDIVVVIGSSGSEHFVTGISNCRTVISIDINRKSDIFDYSDYCITGDAARILQEIIKMVEVSR